MGITQQNSTNDIFWMQQAYNLALQAQTQQEVPVGAVLISKDNILLGSGYNQMIKISDPCAHAEILALRQAANSLHNYRLVNTTLYVTLEPCIMCAGAMISARIQRLVFATPAFKTGAVGSVCNVLHDYIWNHKIQIDTGIMQEDCANLLSGFFYNQRYHAKNF